MAETDLGHHMDLITAKRIHAAALSLDAGFGEMDAAVSQISDEQERRVWAAKLGNVFRSVNEELIIPIEQLHPELHESEPE